MGRDLVRPHSHPRKCHSGYCSDFCQGQVGMSGAPRATSQARRPGVGGVTGAKGSGPRLPHIDPCRCLRRRRHHCRQPPLSFEHSCTYLCTRSNMIGCCDVVHSYWMDGVKMTVVLCGMGTDIYGNVWMSLAGDTSLSLGSFNALNACFRRLARDVQAGGDRPR